MLTDIQLETSQLVFSIEKEIVLMELREMMEKLAKIEDAVRKNIVVNQVVIDSYKPAEDFVSPPKKKMRMT
jgi:molybdopterin converting factor small subunit